MAIAMLILNGTSKIFTVLFSCYYLFFCPVLSAKPLNLNDLWYEIHAKGKKTGYLNLRVTSDTESSPVTRSFEISSYLEVRYLVFFKFTFDSEEKVVIDPVKGLMEYSRVLVVNGKNKVLTTGKLEGDEFTFELTTDEINRKKSYNREEYDYCSLDNPYNLLEKQEEKFKILDLERHEITEVSYTWVRNQNTVIDGDTICCKVIEFKSDIKRGQRWITPDRYGIVIFEEGKLESGHYSLRLSTREKAIQF